jgi:hypothetical protein
MLIQALQQIDKCKQLHQVPIFLGPFEIESFINPKKLLMELPWRFLKPKKNHPTRGFFQNHEPNDIGMS